MRDTDGSRFSSSTREDERAIDQAVNRQRVRRRIDIGHAGMVPLEMQRRGRDDAVRVVQRRAARRFFERHLRVLVEEAGRLFEARARPVGADRRAERARLRRRRLPARDEGRAPRRAESQKPAARPRASTRGTQVKVRRSGKPGVNVSGVGPPE